MSFRDWKSRPEAYVETLSGPKTMLEVLDDEDFELDRLEGHWPVFRVGSLCGGCGADVLVHPCALCGAERLRDDHA